MSSKAQTTGKGNAKLPGKNGAAPKEDPAKVRIVDVVPPKKASCPLCRIVIVFDCGFNNALFLRGQGGDLNWEKGVMLKNLKANEWVYETAEPFHHLEFKVLLNDQQYETGPNRVLDPGATVRYSPSF